MARSSLAAIVCTASLLLLGPQLAVAQCRVQYSSNTRLPLLFGGVNQGCQSLRCQSRGSAVAQKCAARDGSSWGVCTADQAQQALNFARKTLGDTGVNLSPCDLMTYLAGRTLWLLGDSHTKTLWTALQCFLIDFWDHNVCAPSADDNAVNELANLPKVKGHSNCIHLLGPAGGRVCIVEVVLGTSLVGSRDVAAGGVLPLLRAKFAQPQDIFYVNFGAWHRKNNADWATFVPSLEALGRDYQANRGSWPHLLFRENAAMHPKEMEKKVCLPNEGYSFTPGGSSRVLASTPAADADEQGRYIMGRPLAELVHSVLPRFGIPIVDSFNYTAPLFNQHIEMRHVGDLDCIHYCSPGVPQMWIHDLYVALRSGAAGVRPLAPATTRGWGGFGGGGSTTVEERAGDQQQSGGRLFELLRRGFGRRLAEEAAQEQQQDGSGGAGRMLLQQQHHRCVRAKVTF